MKSKQEKLSEKEEGDRTTPNGSIAADENGVCEVAGDTNIKMGHSPQPPEEDDCAGGTFASDEFRPPKKAKSSVDENHSHNELDNGSFNFSGICYCLYLILFIYVIHDLPM